MDIIYNENIRNDDEFLQARLARGAVIVDSSALRTALQFIREEKESAIEANDFESAASWRDEEKGILMALGGFGLAPCEQRADRSE